MKIRLTQKQIKMLKENLDTSDNTGAVINTLGDPNKAKSAIDTVNNLNTAMTNLKTTMTTENDELGDEPVRLELEDHIDELLQSVYGFTFFKDMSTPDVSHDDPNAPALFPNKSMGKMVPFYQTMSSEEKTSINARSGGIIKSLTSGDPNILNDVFAKLIRLKQEKTKIRENNFVDSEMFRIIAEAERPRLTKQEFIEFIKTKKNEI
jgi:hypothetical protein